MKDKEREQPVMKYSEAPRIAGFTLLVFGSCATAIRFMYPRLSGDVITGDGLHILFGILAIVAGIGCLRNWSARFPTIIAVLSVPFSLGWAYSALTGNSNFFSWAQPTATVLSVIAATSSCVALICVIVGRRHFPEPGPYPTQWP